MRNKTDSIYLQEKDRLTRLSSCEEKAWKNPLPGRRKNIFNKKGA
jgi:hypothetical protein